MPGGIQEFEEEKKTGKNGLGLTGYSRPRQTMMTRAGEHGQGQY